MLFKDCGRTDIRTTPPPLPTDGEWSKYLTWAEQIFKMAVTPMLPSKFGVNWPFSQEKKWKIDFQDGGHLGFPIGTIFAIFDLQVTPMLPRKFGVNWPFGLGEEAKNRFSRWRPAWISDRHDFRYFNLQVTLMLPTKYRDNWPMGVGGVGF